MRSFQLLTTATCLAIVFTAPAAPALASGDTYRDVVLADNPLAYYEFEAVVGPNNNDQALDSSPNGNDSVFVGSRTIRKSFDAGYAEVGGLNVNEVSGRVGNGVEFLNADSPGWVNAADSTLCGPFIADCEAYLGGGYIQTGVTLDINDSDSNPSNGNTPIDWSVEISIKNDSILIFNENTSPELITFEENILMQRQFGPDDVTILTTGDLNGDRQGSLEDKAYRSGFGDASFATDTPFDSNTPETNAGNLLTFEGEWETIVLTFQASTNEMRWYSEGQLINTDVLVNPDFNSVDDSWFIGQNEFFNWQHNPSILVDEFSVYDYRLSDAQVLAHFNAISATTGLLADFDGDNDVDGNDFLVWQRGLGTEYDATDLANWQNEYGSIAAATAATIAVPEPSTGMLLLAATSLLALARKTVR